MIDQLTSETRDSLAQDSMRNVDQEIDGLVGSSVNGSTTFQFPEGTGADVSAAGDEGVAILEIETVDQGSTNYSKRTIATSRGLPDTGQKTTALGTIFHETDDGTITAYQGGGLWQKASPEAETRILSEPNLDYTGEAIDLGIVNITSIGAISEGEEVQASRDAAQSLSRSEQLTQFMASYWTDWYNPNTNVPVNITLRIESQFADGWATYAQKRLSKSPRDVTMVADDEVVIDFGTIGDDVAEQPDPNFGNQSILYSGASEWATEYYNSSAWPPGNSANGEIAGNGSTFEVVKPPTDKKYELALYNGSGQWLIYNSTSTENNWTDSAGDPVDPNATEAINNSHGGVKDKTPSNTTFHVEPPRDIESPATPVCIVAGTSPNVRDHIDKDGEDCLERMVGVKEGLVGPMTRTHEFDVTVPKGNVSINTAGTIVTTSTVTPSSTVSTATVGDQVEVKVDIENVGNGEGSMPLGVYVINESMWKGPGNRTDPVPKFGEAYLVDGAENVTLGAGNSTTLTEQLNVTAWMANDTWTVFATTGVDVDVPGDPKDMDSMEMVEVPETNSTFAVENIGTNAPVTEGETLDVNVTVNETQNDPGTRETQELRLEANGTIIGQERITLGSGNDTTVNFQWQTRDGDEGSNLPLEASTYDDTKTTDIDIDDNTSGNAAIEVTQFSGIEDEEAGEEIDVDVEVKNNGSVKGDGFVELQQMGVPGGPDKIGVTDVTGLDPGDTTDVTITWDTDVADAGTQTLRAATDQNHETTTVNIDPPSVSDSEFEVDIDSTTSPVVAGTSLDVEVTVKNNGSSDDSQFVSLKSFNGDQVDFEKLDIDKGKSKTRTLTWDTRPTDDGSGPIVVSTDDNNATANVDVTSPKGTQSVFDVEILGSDLGVTAGDTLPVDVEVTNTGNQNDTQFVYLRDFDDNVVGTEQVSLVAGESKTITLEWSTGIGDGGKSGKVTVASNDKSDTASAEIFDPNTDESNFEVDIEQRNSKLEVTESETLTVEATIENTGDSSDTQFVVLENFDGGPVDVKEIELNSGEQNTTTFTWETIVGDKGTGEVTVVTADDADSAQATIEEKQNELRDPVDVAFVLDETGSMDWNDPNSERIEATKTGIDALNASLKGEGDKAAWVLYTTALRGTNAYTMQSLTNNHTTLKNDLTAYGVGGTDIVAAIEEGEDVLDDGSNDGYMILLTDGKHNYDCEDEDDPYGECANEVRDAADNVDENTTIYTVAFGNYLEEPLEYAATQGGTGEGELLEADEADELESIFESIVQNVTEPDTPTFEVDIVDTNEPIESGKTLNVTAEVTNTGEVGGERIVSLADFDGENVDSETLNLTLGESEQITLQWDTTGEQPTGPNGDDVTVRSVDDTDTENVEITAPKTPASQFDVAINSIDTPVVEGETLTVDATIFNNGAADTQDIVLWDFNKNEVVDTEEITLGNQEQQSITLAWDTELGDAGSGDVTVASADDKEANSASIKKNQGSDAAFEVDIDKSASTLSVQEGDTVSFAVEVTNVGNSTATRKVFLFDHQNALLGAQSVDLDAGETTGISLDWQTTQGDALNETFTVETNTDQDSALVTVSKQGGVDSNVQVDIVSTTSPVVAGGPLEVTAEVENTGSDDVDNQNIVLRDIDGDVADIETIDADTGDVNTVTLTWDTEVGDDGTGNVSVGSGDDSDTANATVLAPSTGTATLVVDNVDYNDPITAGDTFSVDVTVQNIGTGNAADELVWMELTDTTGETVARDHSKISLGANASKTTTLTWDSSQDDVGDYTLTAATNDDSEKGSVTVDPSLTNLDVRIVSTNEPVTAGKRLAVTTAVENVGAKDVDDAHLVLKEDASDTEVGFRFDVPIDAGDTEMVTLEWNTRLGDGDDENDRPIRVEIANTNEDAETDVTIEEADGTLDGPTIGTPANPLDIDLEEIEIDS